MGAAFVGCKHALFVREAFSAVYDDFRIALRYDFRNNDTMQTVKQFIDALGGTVKVASDLQLPISTVSGWNVNNSVPKWRRDALGKLAKKARVEMPETFAPQDEAA